MVSTYKNRKALELLAGEDSLLDATVTCISVREVSGEIDVALEIDMRTKSQFKEITFIFHQVTEYGFYWEQRHIFGVIENYKLLKTKDEYYLSIDPDESIASATERDQDFIRAKQIKIMAIKT